MSEYEIKYMSPNGRKEPLVEPIADIDIGDGHSWVCNGCGNFVSSELNYCPECTTRKGKCGYSDIDVTGIETFAEYYDNWKDETKFLSVGEFDNENFKALCNPRIVPIWETIIGVQRILDIFDDKVAYAVNEAIKNYIGNSIIECDGFVTLHEYCTELRKVLIVLTKDFANIEDEALNGVKNY